MDNCGKVIESMGVIVEDRSSAQDESSGHVGDPQPLSGFKLYANMGSLTLVLFLAALDILIMSASIEVISEQFNDYSKSGWIVSGYSLPEALLTLLWGRFATIFGFKLSLLLSILIFETGSLISAVSNSMNVLIGGRVVAGIGGSGIQSLCFVIASTLTTERSRGVAISVLSCAYAVAAVASPFMGSAFTTHVTWRWCFYINLPIGGLAFAVLVLTYKPHEGNSARSIVSVLKSCCEFGTARLFSKDLYLKMFNELVFGFDFIGFIFCSVGFILFRLGLTFGGDKYTWSSGAIIVYFVVGVTISVAFLLYDFMVFPKFGRVRKNASFRPLVPWSVVSRPGIATAVAANFLMCVAYSAQVVYIIQFFQLVRGSDAWRASIHVVALEIPDIITVAISGAISRMTGHVKPIIFVGIIAGLVGAGLLTLLDNDSGSSKHIGLLILPGVAFGAMLQGSLLSCQLQIPKDSASFMPDFVSTTTVHTFSISLGMSFGSVLATMVFGTSLHNKIASSGFEFLSTKSVDELVSYRIQNFDGTRSGLGYIFGNSIKNVFWMALGLCALAFIFGIFTSNEKLNLESTGKTTCKRQEREERGGEKEEGEGEEVEEKEEEEEEKFATKNTQSTENAENTDTLEKSG